MKINSIIYHYYFFIKKKNRSIPLGLFNDHNLNPKSAPDPDSNPGLSEPQSEITQKAAPLRNGLLFGYNFKTFTISLPPSPLRSSRG